MSDFVSVQIRTKVLGNGKKCQREKFTMQVLKVALGPLDKQKKKNPGITAAIKVYTVLLKWHYVGTVMQQLII